jgi:hypothetical protein
VGSATSLDCGVPIDVLQGTDSALTMTGQFPADVYLVQAGAVVSAPGTKDSVGQQVSGGPWLMAIN